MTSVSGDDHIGRNDYNCFSLLPSEERVSRDITAFLEHDWYCLIATIFVTYCLAEHHITKAYVLEGSVTALVSTIGLNRLFFGAPKIPQNRSNYRAYPDQSLPFNDQHQKSNQIFQEVINLIAATPQEQKKQLKRIEKILISRKNTSNMVDEAISSIQELKEKECTKDDQNKLNEIFLVLEKSVYSDTGSHSTMQTDRIVSLLTQNDYQVIDVQRDGSCGFAAMQLGLDVLNGEVIPDDCSNKIVDAKEIQKNIAKESKKLAGSYELFGCLDPSKELYQCHMRCAWDQLKRYGKIESPPEGFTHELTNELASLFAEELEKYKSVPKKAKSYKDQLYKINKRVFEFTESMKENKGWQLYFDKIVKKQDDLSDDAAKQKKADIAKQDAPTHKPRTWKEKLQLTMWNIHRETRQKDDISGVPLQLLTPLSKSEEEAKRFIFFEDVGDNVGWKAYLAAQRIEQNYWATELDNYLFHRIYKTKIELACAPSNRTIEWKSLLTDAEFNIKKLNLKGTVRFCYADRHYMLVLTPEDQNKMKPNQKKS